MEEHALPGGTVVQVPEGTAAVLMSFHDVEEPEEGYLLIAELPEGTQDGVEGQAVKRIKLERLRDAITSVLADYDVIDDDLFTEQ